MVDGSWVIAEEPFFDDLTRIDYICFIARNKLP
jgi:hypothetical protein